MDDIPVPLDEGDNIVESVITFGFSDSQVVQFAAQFKAMLNLEGEKASTNSIKFDRPTIQDIYPPNTTDRDHL